MRDFCGRNGCYELSEDCQTGETTLSVFLNSVPTFNRDDDGQLFPAPPDCRTLPDLVFYIDENGYVNEMNVSSLNLGGANQFVSALMMSTEDIQYKEGLIDTIKNLLEQHGAVWGMLPEEQWDYEQER